jgi:4-amino-4-deoxy-L-arabinose transferase-like glycosyltransferase
MQAADHNTRLSVLAKAIAFVVMLVATSLIIRADVAYNQTADEATHIACGMEWLAHGTYTYETLHPPLSRIAVAFLPWLSGASEGVHSENLAEDGTAILNWNGHYTRTLLLSRLGILPFFWFAGYLVFHFISSYFDAWHGTVAVVLYAFCPVILGYSALAITDAPLMAMFLWSLVSFSKCLTKWTPLSALIASVSLGMACLTKFTEVLFFLLAAIILIVQYWIYNRNILTPIKRLILVALCASPVIWAGYRFSYGPVFRASSLSSASWQKLDSISPRIPSLLVTAKIPAPEFFNGIYVANRSIDGKQQRMGYLLGSTYQGGRLDYYPIAVLAKTTIPMLLLCLFGVFVCCESGNAWRFSQYTVLICGLMSPLILGMMSKINIGIRHVLPIFPFMAMLGAIGAMRLWKLHTRRPWICYTTVSALLAWDVACTLRATPDFFPYFNEIAAPYGGYIVADSNLDWGQGFNLLKARLGDTPPQDIYLDYFGDGNIVTHSMVGWHKMTPDLRPVGWVAISESHYRENAQAYSWLNSYPYVLVGKSIRLYHFVKPPA